MLFLLGGIKLKNMEINDATSQAIQTIQELSDFATIKVSQLSTQLKQDNQHSFDKQIEVIDTLLAKYEKNKAEQIKKTRTVGYLPDNAHYAARKNIKLLTEVIQDLNYLKNTLK